MTHPTHKTRPSDSSLYDEVCVNCGATDARGETRLDQPCQKDKPAVTQANRELVDTSLQACAIACMLVSNPQGALRKDGDGWQIRVNDLIRALAANNARLAAEIASLKAEGFALHTAYLRLRTILNAFNTPHAPTCEQVWARTEAKAEAICDEVASLKTVCKRLSDALLKVRPLGGSELFIRVGDDYYADPDYCGAAIDKLRHDLHESRMDVARLTHAKPAKPEW